MYLTIASNSCRVPSHLSLFARQEITLIFSFIYPFSGINLSTDGELSFIPTELCIKGMPNTGHISGTLISSKVKLNGILPHLHLFLIFFNNIFKGFLLAQFLYDFFNFSGLANCHFRTSALDFSMSFSYIFFRYSEVHCLQR